MKKFIISLFGLIVLSNAAYSQANPGYLGKKQLVEIKGNLSVGSFLFGSGNFDKDFEVNYEFSRSKSSAWQFGYRNASMSLRNDNNGDFYAIPTYYDGNSTYFYSKGMANIAVNEVYFTPKFFQTQKGAIAPYGSYVGLELALAKLSLKDTTGFGWTSGISNVQYNPVYLFSTTLQFGVRRIIADQFALNYGFSTGIGLYNTASTSIYDISEENQYNSPDEALQHAMSNNYACGKLFKVYFGVGYLF